MSGKSKTKVLFITGIAVAGKQKEFETEKIEEHVKNVTSVEKPSLCFIHNPQKPHLVVEKVKDKKHHVVFFYDTSILEAKTFGDAIKKKMNGSTPKMYATQKVESTDIAVCAKHEIATIIVGLQQTTTA
jgi:hypothetical protein